MTSMTITVGASEEVPVPEELVLTTDDFLSDTYAIAMDEKDPLKGFRQEFLFPQHADSDECVYLCGNSLGLQPKKTREVVNEELDKWARSGVEGHFTSSEPWVTVDELCVRDMAKIVGALEHEVTTMNSLTVNLHLMMISFYRPTESRNMILIEEKAFPSDFIAVRSQILEKGYNPDDCILTIGPREGEETIRTSDIEAKIQANADKLALVMLPGIQYYTGQAFAMERITSFTKNLIPDCKVGFDLAHAVGNIQLDLHSWNVDFACWCTYKYLNSGPGSIGGCFVHSKYAQDENIPRLCGWWGHRKDDRFMMESTFIPSNGAFGWQLSNPPVLLLSCLRASLELFSKATMPALRKKSVCLTRYLEILIEHVIGPEQCRIITPSYERHEERGSQLSLVFTKPIKKVHEYVSNRGVICDMREPDVMRIAPAPIYNSFHDVYTFVMILKEALENS